MKHINRWYPDTCDCVIEYEWDDSEVENERTQRVVRFVKVCDAHQKLLAVNAKIIGNGENTEVVMSQEDKERLWKQVVDENKRKNYVLVEIMNQVPEITEEVITPDGNKMKDLKKGIIYQWRFDENRNLIVSFKGAEEIIEQKKNYLINHLRSRGFNKIEIE